MDTALENGRAGAPRRFQMGLWRRCDVRHGGRGSAGCDRHMVLGVAAWVMGGAGYEQLPLPWASGRHGVRCSATNSGLGDGECVR